MLELCDIYSRREEGPRTRETGTFRRMVISRMVKSSAWFLSPLFIAVALCCEMLRGQNTLRGHRAVGLERPHELLWGTETCTKVGVAPAQSGVLSVPELIAVPCATSSAADCSENPTVNRKVNDRVNCVFHAPFTLGRSIPAGVWKI